MCKIMEDMRNKTYMEAVAETLYSLVKKGLLAIEDAAKELKIDVPTFTADMNSYYEELSKQ